MLVAMRAHSARPLPIPKCGSAVAATLPAPPAALSPIYMDVVRRESMAVTTLIGNFLGGNLAAAVSARERNNSRAISRDQAPATTFDTNSCGFEQNPAIQPDASNSVRLLAGPDLRLAQRTVTPHSPVSSDTSGHSSIGGSSRQSTRPRVSKCSTACSAHRKQPAIYWCARGGDRQIDRFLLRVDILRNSRTVSRRPSRVREKQTMPLSKNGGSFTELSFHVGVTFSGDIHWTWFQISGRSKFPFQGYRNRSLSFLHKVRICYPRASVAAARSQAAAALSSGELSYDSPGSRCLDASPSNQWDAPFPWNGLLLLGWALRGTL
jgi:hypothetical protein